MSGVRPCRGYCGAFEHTKRTTEVTRIRHPILLLCKYHRHVLCLASHSHIWNQGALRLASHSRIRKQSVGSFSRVWNQCALRLASHSRIRKQSVGSFNRVWNQCALRLASLSRITFLLWHAGGPLFLFWHAGGLHERNPGVP